MRLTNPSSQQAVTPGSSYKWSKSDSGRVRIWTLWYATG